MSLYYEAAAFISESSSANASLKSRIFGSKNLKSKPAHVYALISNATKWSQALKIAIEKSEILKIERKLTPSLALLLTHDLLLSKDGIAAPKNHVLKLTISKHKARLGAEFTKARLKAGFASVEAWSASLTKTAVEAMNGNSNQSSSDIYRHPRWIRVNSLKSSMKVELTTTFAAYEHCTTLKAVLQALATGKLLKVDENIPNLIALPPGTDISKSKSYTEGRLIFQDKASCFPAYFLDYSPGDGDCIDACAAPGNKTTHLAAIMHEWHKSLDGTVPNHSANKIWACERDKTRSETLKKMVHQAGANSKVTCLAAQDFLDLDPDDAKWSRVGALLLDPSCSGSGIVGRDEEDHESLKPSLPARDAASTATSTSIRSKKRKRQDHSSPKASPSTPAAEVEEETPPPAETSPALTARLHSLSNFQTRLLTHAMAFPSARKIAYSTCSIHAEENENVVMRALSMSTAKKLGWRIRERQSQADGMKQWPIRGDKGACLAWQPLQNNGADEPDAPLLGVQEREAIAESCIRCEKGTAEGTMGFFVAGFMRQLDEQRTEASTGGHEEHDEEEWEGLSDY